MGCVARINIGQIRFYNNVFYTLRRWIPASACSPVWLSAVLLANRPETWRTRHSADRYNTEPLLQRGLENMQSSFYKPQLALLLFHSWICAGIFWQKLPEYCTADFNRCLIFLKPLSTSLLQLGRQCGSDSQPLKMVSPNCRERTSPSSRVMARLSWRLYVGTHVMVMKLAG